jgi:hypothetical protein
MDDLEAVARAFIEGMRHPEHPDTVVSRMAYNGGWEPAGPMWKVKYADAAQAAIDTLKSRGWTPPKEKP